MLLPALNKAKQAAHGIVCANNMRQVGIGGLLAYANDYEGWGLGDADNYFGFDLSARTNWVLILSKYPYSSKSLGYLDWQYKVRTIADGMFACPMEKQAIDTGNPSVNFGINTRLASPIVSSIIKWKKDPRGLFRIYSPKCPSRLMYLADCQLNYYLVGNDPNYNWREPSRRHNAGTNVFFLDGHVSRLKYSELTWIPDFSIQQYYPWSGE